MCHGTTREILAFNIFFWIRNLTTHQIGLQPITFLLLLRSYLQYLTFKLLLALYKTQQGNKYFIADN